MGAGEEERINGEMAIPRTHEKPLWRMFVFT